MVRIRLLLREKPVLDRRQRHVTSLRVVMSPPLQSRRHRRLTANGRGREDLPRGQRIPRLMRASDDLQAENRVASEFEEVVIRTHVRDVQDVAPNRGQQTLQLARHQRLVSCGVHRRRRLRHQRWWQRATIDLTRRIERPRREDRHLPRDKVVREPLREIRLQRGWFRSRSVPPERIAHQKLAAPAVRHRHHQRASHVGMLRQHGLDLTRLHAEAADLHLVVHAAEEFNAAIRTHSSKVARAIGPRARSRRARIGDESLGRKVGTTEIAARHSDAADPDLAGHPDRLQLAVGIHDIRREVRDRTAEGDLLSAGRDLLHRRTHRGLGRTVCVEEHPALGPRAIQLRARGLAGHEQRAESGEIRRTQHREQCRWQRRVIDARLPQLPREFLRRRHGVARLQPERRPTRQRQEDFRHRGVEADRRELQHALPGPHARDRRLRRREVRKARLFHQHTLRPTGRTRGVDEVRDVLRRDRRELLRCRRSASATQFGVDVPLRRSDAGREACGTRCIHEEERGPGVVEKAQDPFACVRRIYWQEECAGAQDADHRHDELRALVEAQRHRRAAPDAAPAQLRRHTTRAIPEVHVAELTAGSDQRWRRRRTSDLLLQEVEHRLRPVAGLRGSAQREERRPLSSRQRIQIRQSRRRRKRQPQHKTLPLFQETIDRVRRKAGRIIREAEVEPLSRHHRRREREVRLLAGLQSREAQARRHLPQCLVAGVVLEDKDRLKQRLAAADLAPTLNRRQGRVLELARLRLRLLQGLQPGQKCGLWPHRHPQRQRVDEESDHLLDSGQFRRPTSDRNAKHYIAPESEALQQEGPRSLEQGVEGESLAPRPRAQGVAFGQTEHALCFARCPSRRDHAGPRQSKIRRAGETGELTAPECLGRTEVLSAQPLDVIAVRAHRRRPRCRAAASLIIRQHVAEDERKTPAVEQDVMMAPQPAPPVRRGTDQREPHQGCLAEIKARHAILREQGSP